MRITIIGAAGGEVTGSAYVVQTREARILVDCGLFQGGKRAEAKPTLARMICRDDVRGSEVISVRRVSNEALATGTFDFEDRVAQSGARRRKDSHLDRSRRAGRRVEGQSVTVTDGSFSIGTGRDKTFHYEVAFAE